MIFKGRRFCLSTPPPTPLCTLLLDIRVKRCPQQAVLENFRIGRHFEIIDRSFCLTDQPNGVVKPNLKENWINIIVIVA